jgi:Fe-S cluster assembly protein SufD
LAQGTERRMSVVGLPNSQSVPPAVKSWQAAFDARDNVTTRQREAFANFLAAGLPSTKTDAWKYTDLRRLALRQFQVAQGSDRTPVDLLQFKHALLWIDGVLRPSSTLDSRIKVSVDLPAALGVIDNIGARRTPFDYLNEALATQSVTLEIADVIEEPIYVAYAWTAAAKNLMTHPRVTLNLLEGAKATVIEHSVGVDEGGNFVNVAITVSVGEHAALEHVRLQEDGFGNFNIAATRAHVARGGSYVNHHYVLGGGLARTDIDVVLEGTAARSELHGLVLARQTQHLDVRTCIEHRSPDTQSREDYRGIADQRGRVVFNGKVIVAKDAQRTDAAQSSRNLLLSSQAEIDTRPELEIYANDVKCAHGATVGQLDATALFYLQSRGLAKDEARALLTHAFAAEVIERVPVDAVRERLVEQLMLRIPTGELS